MEKFLSRKLILTVFAVTIVAGTSLTGLDLSDESLNAIVTMVLFDGWCPRSYRHC